MIAFQQFAVLGNFKLLFFQRWQGVHFSAIVILSCRSVYQFFSFPIDTRQIVYSLCVSWQQKFKILFVRPPVVFYLWIFCKVKEIVRQLYSLCYFYLAYFSISNPQYFCYTGSKTKGVSANLNMYKFEVSVQVTGQMYLYVFNAHCCWDYLQLYLRLVLYLLFQISHFFVSLKCTEHPNDELSKWVLDNGKNGRVFLPYHLFFFFWFCYCCFFLWMLTPPSTWFCRSGYTRKTYQPNRWIFLLMIIFIEISLINIHLHPEISTKSQLQMKILLGHLIATMKYISYLFKRITCHTFKGDLVFFWICLGVSTAKYIGSAS